MKRLLTSILLFTFFFALGQKPPIQPDTYKSWPEVTGDMGLSTDGKYAYYRIDNLPAGSTTVKIASTEGREFFSMEALRSCSFSGNSRFFISDLKGDSLLMFDIKSKKATYLSGVRSFNLQKFGTNERLFYEDTAGTLHIADLDRKILGSYKNVVLHKVSDNGNLMVFVVADKEKGLSNVYELHSANMQMKKIFSGNNISSIIFDAEAKQVAFFAEADGKNSIYYHNITMESASLLVSPETDGLGPEMTIEEGREYRFSKNGDYLFFNVMEKKNGHLLPTNPDLEIWSYEDAILGSSWYGNTGDSRHIRPRSYLSHVNINSKKVQQLLHNDEGIVLNTFSPISDSILVIQSKFGEGEMWNKKNYATYSILNSYTGERIQLESKRPKSILSWSVSPSGRYIAYFDTELKQVICYDMKERVKRNISSKINDKFVSFQKLNFPLSELKGFTFTGWISNDSAILANGTFDIWKLDPKGMKSPENVTGGLGNRDSIIFLRINARKEKIISNPEQIILTGLNVTNMDYGFYSLNLRNGNKIKKLSSKPQYSGEVKDWYETFGTLEGNIRSGFLLRLESATSAPNCYYSKSLERFSPVSNIQPQKAYQWLTTELHTYRDTSGKVLRGVLYKPENFDTTKRYPLLIDVYAYQSNLLNCFQKVTPARADFNIPLMVGRGYLIFKPDLIGQPSASGAGALKSINAALDHLIKFTWIDSTKIALSGHSFGGFEVNYIATHSTRFAAFIAGAGYSNMVNSVAPWFDGPTSENYVLYDYPMMNNTLGNTPDVYIENSPILCAKRVSSPILFMHNYKDTAVPFQETRNFFITLRTLQKQCWWLNYKNQTHLLSGKAALDYQEKVTEYLDYFLRAGKMPDWMQRHIL